MAAAAGLAVAAVAVLVAAALPLRAAGAYADCYDYCFKDCISKDKSMRDYCSYACDKTCAPDLVIGRPAAGDVECQVDCVRKFCHAGVRPVDKEMEECYGRCYYGCKTKTGMPRPLRAGAYWPAALPDHPFHEKQDGVGPAALTDHPFHEKQDGVWPAALPDHPFHEKQDGVGPAAALFHEKQDAVQPIGEPDPDDDVVSHQEWGTVLP